MKIYKIIFTQYNKVYTIFAKKIYDNIMIGFIKIKKIIFKKRNTILLNTKEEKIKKEFKNVQSFYIPLHSILRIDIIIKKIPHEKKIKMIYNKS